MPLSATVNRPALVEALRIVSAAAKPTANAQIPTHHVLISADGETLGFRATDLELTIQTSCDATVTGNGSATVEHKRLAGLVGKLDSETIQIEVKESVAAGRESNRLRVIGGSSEYELESLSERMFPSLVEQTEAADTLEIGAKDFIAAMKISSFAVSPLQSDRGFTLRCAWLRSNNTSTLVESTDGYRMLRQRVHSRGSCGSGAGVIPFTAMRAVQAVECTDEEGVTLSWGDRMLSAAFPNVTIMARLEDVRLPDVEGVYKGMTDGLTWLIASRDALHSAFDRTMTIGDSTGKIKKIVSVSFEPGRIILTRDTETESAREQIASDSTVSIKCQMNGTFVTEFLSAIDADRIAIGAASNERAFIMRDAAELGSELPDIEYILMPIVMPTTPAK